MSSSDSPTVQLSTQWSNPGDILSLLLLVGGDVVQKALAQFVGNELRLSLGGKRYISLRVAPVAFSFGWVAYAFTSLTAAFGEKRLLPDAPDCPSILINCHNGYVRENGSWILGRILRDHEARHEVDANQQSIRIDLFEVRDHPAQPAIEKKWVFGWAVILFQHVFAAVPWIVWGYWPVFLVTCSGSLLALFTSSLPQWSAEKWSGRRLNAGKTKTVCLTRGNGQHHAMIIIANAVGWDLESLASGVPAVSSETRSVMLLLCMTWTLLLITVSGLKSHTWFLVGVGAIGMLQNFYIAEAPRSSAAFDVHLKKYDRRPTIIGYRPGPNDPDVIDVSDSDEEFDPAAPDPFLIGTYSRPDLRPLGVFGALAELEKEVEGAGAALLNVFFPTGMQYEGSALKFNYEKKFWKATFRRLGRPVI